MRGTGPARGTGAGELHDLLRPSAPDNGGNRAGLPSGRGVLRVRRAVWRHRPEDYHPARQQPALLRPLVVHRLTTVGAGPTSATSLGLAPGLNRVVTSRSQ